MAGMQVTWEVTNQSQTTKFDNAGNEIPGKNVTYKTSTGYEGTVFVPDSVYGDPSNVRDIINAQVKDVAGVHGLKGSVTS